MTKELDLAPIEARYKNGSSSHSKNCGCPWGTVGPCPAAGDVPVLLAEVRRLRAEVAQKVEEAETRGNDAGVENGQRMAAEYLDGKVDGGMVTQEFFEAVERRAEAVLDLGFRLGVEAAAERVEHATQEERRRAKPICLNDGKDMQRQLAALARAITSPGPAATREAKLEAMGFEPVSAEQRRRNTWTAGVDVSTDDLPPVEPQTGVERAPEAEEESFSESFSEMFVRSSACAGCGRASCRCWKGRGGGRGR